jgi:hypothetical protein
MALSDLFQKWTQPYEGYTPEKVDTRRLLIAQMLNQGRQADSVGEGLVALAGGVLGGIQNKKLDRTEEAGRQSAEAAFNAAMGGWSPFAAPMMGSAGEDTLGTASTGGNRDEFIAAMMPHAMRVSQATGLDPRLVIAQAAQETGWGKHAPNNNYFGIKSHGKPGGATMQTTEYMGGGPVQMADSFRTYGGMGQSADDYAAFLKANPRYSAMLAAPDLQGQVSALGRSGYATDPNYATSVGSIANSIPLPEGYSPPMTGGAGNTSVTGQAGADVLSGGSGNSTAIYQALANPWLSQEQRAALMQMLEQNDPLRQLQLQEAQMRVQQMQQPDVPDPAQYGTTLNYFQKQDGTLGAYVLGNDGNPKEVPLPDGAAWAQGVDKVDLGTEYALIDKRTGALIGNMPKDVASEAAQRAAGAKTGEAGAAAAMDLPNVIAQGDQAISLIHSIMTDPALSSVTGMFQGRLPPMTQEGTDLAVKIDQLKGKTFLEAFASLKGGGAITEREGQAAQEAIARLNRAQSTDAYIKALNELAQIITTGVARAKAKAGMPGMPQGAAPAMPAAVAPATGMGAPTAPADDPLGLFQ